MTSLDSDRAVQSKRRHERMLRHAVRIALATGIMLGVAVGFYLNSALAGAGVSAYLGGVAFTCHVLRAWTRHQIAESERQVRYQASDPGGPPT